MIGRFLCWIGWHSCDSESFDGASFAGRCRRCGCRCLLDSQGNWFAAPPVHPTGQRRLRNDNDRDIASIRD